MTNELHGARAPPPAKSYESFFEFLKIHRRDHTLHLSTISAGRILTPNLSKLKRSSGSHTG